MVVYIDISNFFRTRAHTGIQRVLKEFLNRAIFSNTVTFKAVVYDPNNSQFGVLSTELLEDVFFNTKSFSEPSFESHMEIKDFLSDDIFMDMDAIWNFGLNRSYLYRQLKGNGTKIYNFLYDMVPIIKPQYSHSNTIHNFTKYIYAVLEYSDMVFFDSRSAEIDFFNIKKSINNTKNISSRVVKLGCDLPVKKASSKPVSIVENNLLDKKYILFVGTIEPRKNQKLVLDTFKELYKNNKDLHLILVGKEGWNSSVFIHEINKFSKSNNNFHWLSNVNDEELQHLYKGAFICTYLSAYEGFGLPIAESLRYGNVTIASKNSSMYEVGRELCDYVKYNTVNELYDIIDLYLNDEQLYLQKKKYIKENHNIFTWEDMYLSMENIFSNGVISTKIVQPETLQFVFISIDFHNLQGTLKAIDNYISFVKEIIIVTKSDLVEEFSLLESKYQLIIIDESKIISESMELFSSRDHVAKNWILRTSLCELDVIDDVFIMLDDDNRPLKEITIDHFITEGKYKAYYFYELLNWRSYKTDYDVGQNNMKDILDVDGFELLSYSSHKPQVIDKNIFKEVVAKYAKVGKTTSVDEWSIYFNFAMSCYPHLFIKKKFDTMNWPDLPSHWEMNYYPDEYIFENYYASSYRKGFFEDNFQLDDKVKFKKKQLAPYQLTQNFMEEISEKITTHNIVHGVMKFETETFTLYVQSMPYFLKAQKGGWLKVDLNYKVLFNSKRINNEDLSLLYYINGNEGYNNQLHIDYSQDYYENVMSFAISCENIVAGEYDLLIDLSVGSKKTYHRKSPYMLKLLVVA